MSRLLDVPSGVDNQLNLLGLVGQIEEDFACIAQTTAKNLERLIADNELLEETPIPDEVLSQMGKEMFRQAVETELVLLRGLDPDLLAPYIEKYESGF
ncbi:MAG: hypothetical protein HC848_06640 [Limnobacter sp.]|nr:hypothetical protein [Limnobacter sp.]